MLKPDSEPQSVWCRPNRSARAPEPVPQAASKGALVWVEFIAILQNRHLQDTISGLGEQPQWTKPPSVGA